MRKILIVNKYHFLTGGAERYFFSIMDALARRGIEAIPLSVNYSGTLPSPYRRYFIDPPGQGDDAKIVNQRPRWHQKLRLAGRVIYNRHAAAAVRRIARDHRPDLAYFLNFNNHISPSAIDACVRESIPVVMRMSDFNLVCSSNMYYRDGRPCTDCKSGVWHAVRNRCVHGSATRSAVSALALSLHRWSGIYRRVSAFVAPTEFMQRELLELGFPSEIVQHINTFAEPQEASEPERRQPYVLFHGRFVPYKGADTAIAAFARIADKRGVSLRLMGDEGDSDGTRVRALARTLACPSIEILPFERDKQKVLETVRKSLFTVLPSENYENLPNSILESFACGRPVISTRIGCIPDIVKDGEYGLLCEYRNVADFSAKIAWLIANESARETMGARARAAIARDYSEDQHLERLLRLCEAVVRAAGLRSQDQSPRSAIVGSTRLARRAGR